MPQAARKKSNGKRVLTIDDDGLARDIYRSILEEQGFEVVGAADGKSGIELFRKQKFDCVIVDIYMPGMSGLDVIEELDPESTKVPVIAVSGGSVANASFKSAGPLPLRCRQLSGVGELLGNCERLAQCCARPPRLRHETHFVKADDEVSPPQRNRSFA